MKRELLAEPEPPRQLTAGETVATEQAAATTSGQFSDGQSTPVDGAEPQVPPQIGGDPATPAVYSQGEAPTE
jgi:hypothetical protein